MKMKVPFSLSNCNPILHMLRIVVFCFLLEATNELTVTRKLVHCCKASVTPGNISRYLSRKFVATQVAPQNWQETANFLSIFCYRKRCRN